MCSSRFGARTRVGWRHSKNVRRTRIGIIILGSHDFAVLPELPLNIALGGVEWYVGNIRLSHVHLINVQVSRWCGVKTAYQALNEGS